MTKTKERPLVAADTLRPYVKRAMEDPELREDLLAAFVAARGLYGQLAKKPGMKAKAAKVSEKDFQEQIASLVSELSTATEKLQGKDKKRKSHKMRNRVILLTGVTLGVLYNPWTGEATREWIMERIAGGDGDGLDALAEELERESAAPGNGNAPTEEA
jgi:hypothetical protein